MSSHPDNVDRFRGALLGLAVGDAVGTTVEFKTRGSFAPLTGMRGGGPFNLLPGQWTDDTSLALCLADSLLQAQGFDPRDQMERYLRWYSEGYLSSTGECFDIGGATRSALCRFIETGNPMSGSTDERSAGNGSIMRLAPVPMYFHPDLEAAIHYAGESSRVTHGAAECVDACELLAEMTFLALSGAAKSDVLAPAAETVIAESILDIARGSYQSKGRSEIFGSGYVVRSLEAAVWCFYQTSSYADAILLAANLGDDADTTAAVCGQLAGAYYGRSGIPAAWLDTLHEVEMITDLADRLYRSHTSGS